MIISPVSLNISRYATVSSSGYSSEVLTSSFPAVAEIQPATAEDIQSLPSNEREKETLKLYFDTHYSDYVRLRDRFVFKGEEFRVIALRDHTYHMIPHIKALAVKME